MYRKRSSYFAILSFALCAQQGLALRGIRLPPPIAAALEAAYAMNETNESPRATRKASLHLTVYLLPDELEVIRANARSVGLSASTYLRRVGMGFAPPSTVDSEAVLLLAKINGDQARLGNLLKMWLADDRRLERFGAEQMTATIRLAMERIEELQTALREQVQKL